MSTKDVDMIPKTAVEVEEQDKPDAMLQPTINEGDTQSPTPRAPKARTIEELENASANSMTRTEAIKYIKHLRDQNALLDAKVNALEDNVKGAFAKAQYFERMANLIDHAHNKNCQFILSSMRNLLTSVENHSHITAEHIDVLKKGNN